MRISAKIMTDHIKANLTRQSEQLMETQLRLSSGKRINKPSDDPIGIGKVLDYRTTLETVDQYGANITDAKTRIEFTESVLGQVSEFIEDAKKIATVSNVDDRSGLAQEIRNIRQQVFGLANTKYGANYLFAGHLSDTTPFDPVFPYDYHGDDGSHRVIVGEGITIPIDADGGQMFSDDHGDTLFRILDELETALTDDPYDPTAVRRSVDALYQIADRVKATRGGLASNYKRLERTDAYWKNFSNAVESMRQRVEDADMTQTALDMQVQQTAYEVLLATAARVIQPSLIDFLR
ncbi:MAG: flagellar hook-associated protein FlgL [Desulfosarcina sp.]